MTPTLADVAAQDLVQALAEDDGAAVILLPRALDDEARSTLLDYFAAGVAELRDRGHEIGTRTVAGRRIDRDYIELALLVWEGSEMPDRVRELVGDAR